jgi:hypothetical protein
MQSSIVTLSTFTPSAPPSNNLIKRIKLFGDKKRPPNHRCSKEISCNILSPIELWWFFAGFRPINGEVLAGDINGFAVIN